MALVEGHMVINRRTVQFWKVRDCKVKFPITDFPLHHYLPAITTMRGERDGSLAQENRGEKSPLLEVKASSATLVFQREIFTVSKLPSQGIVTSLPGKRCGRFQLAPSLTNL